MGLKVFFSSPSVFPSNLLKSDQDGIERWCKALSSSLLSKLKSDQDGIESLKSPSKLRPSHKLKSDQDGIERCVSLMMPSSKCLTLKSDQDGIESCSLTITVCCLQSWNQTKMGLKGVSLLEGHVSVTLLKSDQDEIDKPWVSDFSSESWNQTKMGLKSQFLHLFSNSQS